MGEGEERDRGTERKGKENRDHPPTIFGLKVALVAVYILTTLHYITLTYVQAYYSKGIYYSMSSCLDVPFNTVF